MVNIPEDEHAGRDDGVGQQGAYGHHVDQLVQVEDSRHHSWKQNIQPLFELSLLIPVYNRTT